MIIYTTGAYDIFHIGHLNFLKNAKELGGVKNTLIVGVSSDELVTSYKHKPVIPFRERWKIVKAIRYVDLAIMQTERSKETNVEKYNVDVAVMGDDWIGKEKTGYDLWFPSGKPKCKMVYLKYTKGISSSIIKQRIKNESTKV